jgi:23S rRNA (guanosine2251-2'-O)-methyltransferase
LKKDDLVFGLHAIEQIFENDISRVLEIWTLEERNDAKLQVLLKKAKQQHIAIHPITKKTLDKLTENGRHQGMVIRCKTTRQIKTPPTLEELLASLTQSPFLLVLDEVQDPHNLGACLRSADAAGIQAVIVPKNNAVKLTSIVRAVACGAADNIPLIEVTNLARTLRWLQEQGVWIVGTDENGQESLFETNLTGPLAFVFGSEGSGLRRLTKESCDLLVRIPTLGKIKSLNISVATGICLYEAVRQRLQFSIHSNIQS